jgi:hypothetical protein
MTVIPPINGHTIPEIAEVQYQHNWLYSVVPAKQATYQWKDDNGISVGEIGIYLAGYCRTCRHAFSAPIPFGDNYEETELNVPRFGCVDQLAGL